MTKITDDQFKILLDLFNDMNICKMTEIKSEYIDREYSFKLNNTQDGITSKLSDLIPENWSVGYFEDENISIDLIRHLI